MLHKTLLVKVKPSQKHYTSGKFMSSGGLDTVGEDILLAVKWLDLITGRNFSNLFNTYCHT